MGKKNEAIAALLQQKLLPLYYHADLDVSIGIARALYAGGVRIFEYTNRGEAALENFRALRDTVDQQMPGLLLGIGTIKTPDQARDYIAAGADFIVCPSMSPAVAEITAAAGLLWVPGCMTPTEIAGAEEAGATLVKIFPGHLLGPGFISAIKDLFPALRFLVTGGVDAESGNLSGWFASGVAGVGMGSKLITKDIVDRRNYSALTVATIKALQLVRDAGKVV